MTREEYEMLQEYLTRVAQRYPDSIGTIREHRAVQDVIKRIKSWAHTNLKDNDTRTR